MDLQTDLKWALERLKGSRCRIAKEVADKLAAHIVPERGQAALKPIPIDFIVQEDVETMVWDEVIEMNLVMEKLNEIIAGVETGPIVTPVKPKRQKMIQKEEHEEVYVPKPAVNEVTDEQIQKHRANIMTELSERKYDSLKMQCKKEKVKYTGKKSELIERLAERTLCQEYGSPRMRNSYQTAMNSPLPPKTDAQPSSLKSVSSTTSLRSTTSTRSTASTKSTTKKTATLRSRMRSPSPSQQRPLPKTPSFKNRIKETMSGSGFASPRPWSKTPSKSKFEGLSKTPSKADLEMKEAERERKIREKKAAKEQEAAKRKAEKAAHAEEIRKKKIALDNEKKKGTEKVFSLTKEKPKKPGLKEKAAMKIKAQKLESQKRKEEEEQRRLEREREQERLRREEEERREEERKRMMTPPKTAQTGLSTPMAQSAAKMGQSMAGYDMTPQAEDKWALYPSSADNYNIDDLESGDETDDDERPRKKVPAWANMRSAGFKASILRQYRSSANPIIEIFSTINPNRDVDLTELFDSMASEHAQRRYRKPRNSSGVWGTMVQPRPLLDRTLNLDQSVYPLTS